MRLVLLVYPMIYEVFLHPRWYQQYPYSFSNNHGSVEEKFSCWRLNSSSRASFSTEPWLREEHSWAVTSWPWLWMLYVGDGNSIQVYRDYVISHEITDPIMNQSVPIGSMYGIFTYIWSSFIVNVGKYTLHPMDPSWAMSHASCQPKGCRFISDLSTARSAPAPLRNSESMLVSQDSWIGLSWWFGCWTKNRGGKHPQIIHFNRVWFSIIFTIHFGGPPLYLETAMSVQGYFLHCYPSSSEQWPLRPGYECSIVFQASNMQIHPFFYQPHIHLIWVFPKIGGKPPKWMVNIMENLIKIHDLGAPLFLETPYIVGIYWGPYPLLKGSNRGGFHSGPGPSIPRITLPVLAATMEKKESSFGCWDSVKKRQKWPGWCLLMSKWATDGNFPY